MQKVISLKTIISIIVISSMLSMNIAWAGDFSILAKHPATCKPSIGNYCEASKHGPTTATLAVQKLNLNLSAKNKLTEQLKHKFIFQGLTPQAKRRSSPKVSPLRKGGLGGIYKRIAYSLIASLFLFFALPVIPAHSAEFVMQRKEIPSALQQLKLTDKQLDTNYNLYTPIKPTYYNIENNKREKLYNPYTFVFDEKISMKTMATNIHTIYRLLNDYILYPRTKFIENKLHKYLKFTIRTVHTFINAYTVSYFAMLAQHEAGGHGAKAREIGMPYNIKITVKDGGSMSPKGSYTYDTITDDIVVTTGGSESTQLLAEQVGKNIFKYPENNFSSHLYRMNRLDLYIYIRDDMPAVKYFTSQMQQALQKEQEYPKKISYMLNKYHNHDILNYWREINQKYDYKPGFIAKDLELVKNWVLADPTLWLVSLNDLIYIASGRVNYFRPKILPYTSANLTPIGPELYLGLHSFINGKYFSPYIRAGKGGSGYFYGTGFELDDIELTKNLYLDITPHLWKQQEYYGGGLEMKFTQQINENINFVTSIHFKSHGYLKGFPSSHTGYIDLVNRDGNTPSGSIGIGIEWGSSLKTISTNSLPTRNIYKAIESGA